VVVARPRPRRHDETLVGPRLRAARKERGLTISQLAERTGLSNGFISLLERNEVAASVGSLIKLCDALDVGLGSLFEPAESAGLVRRDERMQADFGGFGVQDVLLTWGGQRHLQVIESRVEPGGSSGEELHAFDADAELVYVLAGSLRFVFEDRTFDLRRGDALTLNPRVLHRWQNTSRTREAVVLWIITPASL
jgi:transcriptional regulator with XRE-family HTH domain